MFQSDIIRMSSNAVVGSFYRSEPTSIIVILFLPSDDVQRVSIAKTDEETKNADA